MDVEKFLHLLICKETRVSETTNDILYAITFDSTCPGTLVSDYHVLFLITAPKRDDAMQCSPFSALTKCAIVIFNGLRLERKSCKREPERRKILIDGTKDFTYHRTRK